MIVSKVGRELYDKFFKQYTRKQWGLDPSELDAAVTARVPVRTNRDDRYFTDQYEVMPRHGYTRMFERMLTHPNIRILLNADYRVIRNDIPYRHVIYTGRSTSTSTIAYQAIADATPNVHFLGRLGTYKYYNMDQCIAQALTLYAKLVGARRSEVALKIA